MKKQIYILGVSLLMVLVFGGCGNEERPEIEGLQPIAMDFGSTEEAAGGSREGMDPSSAADKTAGNGAAGTTGEGQDKGGREDDGISGVSGDMEAYKAVLRREGEFLESATGERMRTDQVEKAVTTDAGVSIMPDSFAVVDLDGDGGQEVILSLVQNGNSTYGFLVLRCQEDTVYGYIFSLREFSQLRTDGTFSASAGAADVGICRAFFDKEKVRVDEITYSESRYDQGNELTVAYYVDHAAASKEGYDMAYMR